MNTANSLRAVRSGLITTGTADDSAAVVAALRAAPGAPLEGPALVRQAETLRAELTGTGPLEPLLRDPSVTDVLVNGPDEVWADRGDGPRRVAIGFTDAAQLRRLATRLASACGRRLDDANPYTDARLPDGTRFHAVLPPVAVNGPFLSLRTHRARAFGLDDLLAAGTLTEDSRRLLSRVITARVPFLISGGTGVGKTTLLASLMSIVDIDERIVIVEDATELGCAHPHAVSLQARLPNVEESGAVTMRELVRQALRMRPDRVVIGECRGAEIVELLAALNTGHDGGAGTLHANTAADVPARLAALALPHGISRAGLHALLAAALRVVIHMSRSPHGRVVSEIALLEHDPDTESVTVVPAWRHDSRHCRGYPRLRRLLASRGATSGEEAAR